MSGAAGNSCLVAVGATAIPSSAKPTISAISPSIGPDAGGFQAVITGTGFLPGLTVAFGSTSVSTANLSLTGSTTIAVLVPAGIGNVTVTVTNPDRQTATTTFTYRNPAPATSAISPASGPAKGGTQVNIAGSNFLSGATVLFGATPATAVQIPNAATILCATPAGTGTVDVTIRNPDGQSVVIRSAYTFLPTLSIASVTPSLIDAKGGTSVTITGAGFVPPLAVGFGSLTLAASSVQIVSPTQLVVLAPAMPAGTVTLTLSAGGQTAVFPGFVFAVPDATRAALSGHTASCNVLGSVSQTVLPSTFKVVVYALTNQYYIQPCYPGQVLQPIDAAGKFGPIPSHTGDIYLLLVSADYVPLPVVGALPAVDHVHVFAVAAAGNLSGCDVAACIAQ